MSSRYPPHSQRPVYIDYSPAAGAVCGNCRRPLVGLRPVVYFQGPNGTFEPFGDHCSRSRGIKGWQRKDLPNMTLGSDWMDEATQRPGHPNHQSTPLSEDALNLLCQERERREALEYAFLRVVQLPSLGFLKPINLLRLPCAVTLVETYQNGRMDPGAREKTIFMMKKAAKSPYAGHLSLENLRCCYVVGRQILNIKALGGHLPTLDFLLWRDIKNRLGQTLYLDDKDRAAVNQLSKIHCPHSPIAGRQLHFRGPGVSYIADP